MPIIGEKRRGRELGFRDSKRNYIWAACPDCGKQRWICFRIKGKGSTFRCYPCAAKQLRGENHPNWKGGRVKHSEGYIEVKVAESDFFFSMASSTGYVAEHRLVMAKSLQRCLLPWEIVHHKNGDRTDNRLENLQLISQASHNIRQSLCFHCQLREDIKLLKIQNKFLLEQIRASNLKAMEGGRNA